MKCLKSLKAEWETEKSTNQRAQTGYPVSLANISSSTDIIPEYIKTKAKTAIFHQTTFLLYSTEKNENERL